MKNTYIYPCLRQGYHMRSICFRAGSAKQKAKLHEKSLTISPLFEREAKSFFKIPKNTYVF